MAKFTLLGSSYVTRLGKYCSFDMGFRDENLECRFFGVERLRAENVPSWLLEDLIDWGPQFVFIHLGGNDISTSSSPNEIYEMIVSLVEDLETRGMKVYVGEILTRGCFKLNPGLTELCFEKQRKAINRKLKKKFQQWFVRFPDLKFPRDYDEDQVNLATTVGNKGMRNYYFRVKRVIASTV